MQKRTVRASRQDVADVQKLLTLMGVPWYGAPGEAEAQASRMCAQGVVYGTGIMIYVHMESTLNLFIESLRRISS